MMRSIRLFVLALLIGSSAAAFEPDSDFGAWFSVNVQKRVTRTFSLNVNPQVRFNRNLATVDQYMAELGGEFLITRNFRATLNYRLTESNRLDYFSTRHRVFLDLSYKQKYGRVVIGLRERIQSQFKDVYSSDLGRYPAWYLRTRLSLKYDTDLSWKPYASTEIFYRTRDLENPGNSVDQYRYEVGIDYSITQDQSLNVFYMFKRNPEDRVYNEYITGLGYSITF
ncbi:MAG: DUF2490 domain-containing protein [Bacteroidota bacterium]|jgi:hypothetical protein|uniref:DUF2490 domain-containing protein n=1 Tax=Candidatus Pollutiaquabacter sp. TaxID=3416354 RepID=UPI001A44F7F6|nr:DUF2490 domain-containing protein [Bacteroidota bacterium]MBL7948932.1 DUF2490 domain-containing protein [Bacteroidia bacterium]HRI42086.1 DUF2490 domain-containing protein [Bacteroidia bacterium]HRU60318.1 DUF2490 domain-containing protein [Bacteroidia bacterium]